MMGRTHLAIGALLLFLLAEYTQLVPENMLLASAVILIASILPDIDSSKSFLGSKLKPLKWLFKHRGFFHSIFAMVFFTVVVHLLFKSRELSILFLIGYGSHLAADSVTKEGTKLFYPKDLKIKGPLRVGSFAETVIIFLLVVLVVYLIM